MNQQIIEEISAAALNIDALQSILRESIKKFEDIEGGKFPQSELVPSCDVNTTEIMAAISSLVTLSNSIKVNENGQYIPKVLLSTFSTKLAEVVTQLTSVNVVFGTIESNGGARAIHTEDFSITARNETPHSLSKPFRRLFEIVDGAFAAWYQLRFAIRSPRLGDFSRYAVEIEKQKDTVHETLQTALELTGKVELAKARSDESVEKSAAALNELTRIVQEGQNDRRTIAEYSSEATTRITEIRATDERSAALSASIASYQASFDSFDEQLSNRTRRFDDEGAALLAVRDELAKEGQEVVRLIAESEGLLRGATNVGLAASFSNLQTKIEGELKWAERSFYISIFVLVVLSLPIALYVFPGLQAMLKAVLPNLPDIVVVPKATDPKTSDVLAQIAARALLLIPGIWLVRFAGARHERLFRLREHYAYKYSIASSVEGFKKQAPDLEQAIAATAFYELTFNPATRMDANSTEARHPNPVMEWVMKKLGGSPEGDKSELR